MTLYPDRNLMHRYMAPPESCDRCHGRGWYPEEVSDDPGDCHEVYCQCPAGVERQRLETEPVPSPSNTPEEP